jgi:hypothetical protein
MWLASPLGGRCKLIEVTQRSHSYRASCAQIIGRSHEKSGTPCQDYVAARVQRDFACVALADGAGSKTHSEQGARTVVKAVTRILSDRFDELWLLAADDPSQVSGQLLRCCLEALQHQAHRLGCQLSDLASTLLFVAHSKGRYLAGHLGDGCIVHQEEGGQLVVLSHPENGEYANTTFFVTDATDENRLRVYQGECTIGAGFVVMSDGTAESLYRRSDRSPATAVGQVLSWNRTIPPSEMRAVLGANLERTFSAKTVDDCSIGVLSV